MFTNTHHAIPPNQEEKAQATQPEREGASADQAGTPRCQTQDQGPTCCQEFVCQEEQGEQEAARRSSDLVDTDVARGPGAALGMENRGGRFERTGPYARNVGAFAGQFADCGRSGLHRIPQLDGKRI